MYNLLPFDDDYVVYYYYKFIFPSEIIMRLYGGYRDKFGDEVKKANREVAVRFRKGFQERKFDCMSRYHSFDYENAMNNFLSYKLPSCVFLGAGYSTKPQIFKDNRWSAAKRPAPLKLWPFLSMHHEFVFDLDISDYNHVRTCCQSRNMCSKCWRFMAVACEMIDHLLKVTFGMKHRLWLFSGGRGVHCWCFDRLNLNMHSQKRRLILEHIEKLLLPMNYPPQRKRHLRNPAVVQVYQNSLKYIRDILQEQNCLISPMYRGFLLEYIKDHLNETAEDKKIRDQMINILNNTDRFQPTDTLSNVSLQIYAILEQYSLTCTNAAIVLQCIVQHVVQPRIDAPVTRDNTHLLRCPLSVHMNADCRLVMPFRVANVAQLLDGGVSQLLHVRLEDYMRNNVGQWLRQGLGVDGGRYAEGIRIIEELCEDLEQDELTEVPEDVVSQNTVAENTNGTLSEAVILQSTNEEAQKKIDLKVQMHDSANIVLASKHDTQDGTKQIENSNDKVDEQTQNNEECINIATRMLVDNNGTATEQQLEDKTENVQFTNNTREDVKTASSESNEPHSVRKRCREQMEAATTSTVEPDVVQVTDVSEKVESQTAAVENASDTSSENISDNSSKNISETSLENIENVEGVILESTNEAAQKETDLKLQMQDSTNTVPVSKHDTQGGTEQIENNSEDVKTTSSESNEQHSVRKRRREQMERAITPTAEPDVVEVIDVDEYSDRKFELMMRIFDDSDGDLDSDTDSDVVYIG